jgi:hypothetical protein
MEFCILGEQFKKIAEYTRNSSPNSCYYLISCPLCAVAYTEENNLNLLIQMHHKSLFRGKLGYDFFPAWEQSSERMARPFCA